MQCSIIRKNKEFIDKLKKSNSIRVIILCCAWLQMNVLPVCNLDIKLIYMENQENKQEILDKRYMRMATIWAENSYCNRRKVGALIVKIK